MSKKFAQLPADIQETLATGAGIVLSEFSPDSPGEAEAIRQKILFATSGGVNPVCVATITDWGEDVDNCPKNTKELAHVESWDCSISGTAITVSESLLVSLLAAADSKDGAITPRMKLKAEDFKTLWYVCPYGSDGGFIAIKLENALSANGLSLQAADNAKGQWAFNYAGHTSINDPEKVPMTFYVKSSAAAAAAQVEPTVE